MDQKELKEALGKPQMLRLQAVHEKLKVGKVLGSRVLVKMVTPETEMDRVEKEGLIAIPKHVKQQNTPLATTGIVLLVGPNLQCENCGAHRLVHQLDHRARYCLGGEEMYAPTLREGDMVMMPKFAGSDFKIENEDFRIVEAAEIICTLVDVEGVLEATPGA